MGIRGPFKAENLYVYALTASVAVLPWSIHIAPYAIILAFIFGLFTNSWHEKLDRLRSEPYIYVFMLFYLLYWIGMLYTKNQREGFGTLEQKIYLVALPLIITTSAVLSFEHRTRIFLGFVYSNLILTLVCLALGVWSILNGDEYMIINFDSQTLANFIRTESITETPWMRFSYSAFTHEIINPGYLSLYLVFSLSLILFQKRTTNWPGILGWFVISWFFITIILLASRIGIFLLGALIVYTVFTKIKPTLKASGIAVVSIVIFISTIMLSPVTRYRMVVEPSTTQYELSKDANNWNSTNLRLLEWSGAIKGIQQAGIFGTGTGGTVDAIQEYIKQFKVIGFGNDFNAHNQYIETFLEIGLMGFILLLASYLIPLKQAIKSDNILLLHLCVIIITASITESVLERANGLIFFTAFVSIFMFNRTASYA